MRIVQLIPELNQGGVERVVVEFSRELVKRGNEIIVISAGGTQVQQIEHDGVKHIELDVCSKNPLSVPARVIKLRRLLRDIEPDIIHTHSRVPAWLTWFANKPLHFPHITSVHGFNSVSGYSKIMTKGDHVVCSSNPVKDYIQHHYQTPDEKVTVIHPSVDPDLFNPDIVDQEWIRSFKDQYNLNDRTIISAIGRITELKDYETFIRAVAMSAKTKPEICGLIVGGVRHDKQAHFEQLQQLVKELHMEEHIFFITDKARMPGIYTLSHLVVSCSKKPESFGLTLVEALAMHTPVIASHHGGPLDIIQEGNNGSFFEPQNAEELSEKMINGCSLACTDLRSDVLSRFSLEESVSSIETVYQKLLG